MSPHKDHLQAERLEQIEALIPTVRGRARASDDNVAFPAENFANLRELGLLALTAPTEIGGLGMWSEGSFAAYYELKGKREREEMEKAKRRS